MVPSPLPFFAMCLSIFLFTTGAQIIDLMFLVVDATKGIQTQTAEVGVWFLPASISVLLLC